MIPLVTSVLNSQNFDFHPMTSNKKIHRQQASKQNRKLFHNSIEENSTDRFPKNQYPEDDESCMIAKLLRVSRQFGKKRKREKIGEIKER